MTTKAPKPLKHVWTPRPDKTFLRYCTACGIYEDREMFSSESRSGFTMRNVKVFRPYKKPDVYFRDRKQPPCKPIENGPAEAPPPYVDEMMNTLNAMAGRAG